ncbi:hypothetical protein ABH935_000662 [Catenulispora sp. GAS73]|uniref:hypothetical protein n=1 Tax=Catenulispora sp. GAS73 TaxID=3156269 RepID=UPI0035126145
MPIIDIWVAAALADRSPAKRVLKLFDIADGSAACRVVARNKRADRMQVWVAQAATLVVWLELAGLFFLLGFVSAITSKALTFNSMPSRFFADAFLGFAGALVAAMAIAGFGAARMRGSRPIPSWLGWLYRPSYFTFWTGIAAGVGLIALLATRHR